MNIKSISTEETKRILEKDDEDVVLLDVRTAGENSMEKIANSTLMPLNELQVKASELDVDRKYLIYCATGSRSQIACNILQSAGVENCFDVSGGISSWKRSGFETEKGEGGNPFAQLFGF